MSPSELLSNPFVVVGAQLILALMLVAKDFLDSNTGHFWKWLVLPVIVLLLLLLASAQLKMADDEAQKLDLLKQCAAKGCSQEYLERALAAEHRANQLASARGSTNWARQLVASIPARLMKADADAEQAVSSNRLRWEPLVGFLVSEIDARAEELKTAGIEFTTRSEPYEVVAEGRDDKSYAVRTVDFGAGILVSANIRVGKIVNGVLTEPPWLDVSAMLKSGRAPVFRVVFRNEERSDGQKVLRTFVSRVDQNFPAIVNYDTTDDDPRDDAKFVDALRIAIRATYDQAVVDSMAKRTPPS